MAWTIGTTYTQVNDYSVKDGLASGNAEKIILGADIDDELSGIATAVNQKLDPSSVSSQAEAEAGTDTESVMTPQGVQYWGDANAGIVGDLRALSSPAADRILFWDNSAGAAAFLTVGTGLSLLGTSLTSDDSAIAHDSLSGFVADEHIAHSGVSVIAASNSGLAASNNNLSSNIGLEIDLTGLTNIEGNALAATDEFLVDDGGVNKAIAYQDMGLIVQSAQTTQTLAAADMNTIMEFNGTATLTLPLNSTTALPVGSFVVIVVDHATQEVTVTAAASVTLNSIWHPGGAAAASDVVRSGGTAVAIKVGTDEWYLSGDISDS